MVLPRLKPKMLKPEELERMRVFYFKRIADVRKRMRDGSGTLPMRLFVIGELLRHVEALDGREMYRS